MNGIYGNGFKDRTFELSKEHLDGPSIPNIFLQWTNIHTSPIPTHAEGL